LKYEIEEDFLHYTPIGLDSEVIQTSIGAIEKHQLKSLDSIHLGSALCMVESIDFFVSCNGKILSAAAKENLEVKNPNK